MTRHAILLATLIVGSCAPAEPGQLLYVWMGDEDGSGPDFLAVFDIHEASESFGGVVTTVPLELHHSLPHHSEYELPARGEHLFLNAHMAEKVLLFDLSEPATPRMIRALEPVPPLRFPHDMVALPNGNVLIGYLRSDGPSPVPGDSLVPGGHGGLAEVTRAGELVRWASAADSAVTEPVRPYSFAVVPELDRLVVTSAPMMEAHSADVVQVWSLSDLTLLTTLDLPPALLPDGQPLRTRNRSGELRASGHIYPFEPRVMADGSVLFNAFGCGFYRLTDLDQGMPTLENVYTIEVAEGVALGACGIPVHTGDFWVMTVGSGHALVVLDVSDPAAPHEVARLDTGGDFAPHWLAKDPRSDRLIVGAENGGENRMLLVHLDPTTGALSWDDRLAARHGFSGIDFRRTTWPHGETGEAFGHAALFQR